ncbi:MAG: Uncharacterized protein G01um101418_907 [Parcubacteria group bacterium Gr01-1014_18]|nr:MAG: Uncharacterized protein Greene041636_886 [Parcubacteria group bacterium Greene0416_36]TSC79743.1 MAG: Uncharacterized protein G01um101418_907 [Parcubacteria group bacterium Gr01-1014_18]TSC97921.1 MAG: Uncharacterized protein Greene101420_956 [Parcubacteria group bacterium Greene1014_20]TSD06579.1 MAG: Uncharacterized protein Greene07142_788 [Parcubacteria group bacterium Greene0714_2]
MSLQKHFMGPPRCDNRWFRCGFNTLLSILIVSAVGLVVNVSLLVLSTGVSKNNLVAYQSQSAKALANACAEYALNKVRLGANYIGNETRTIDGKQCEILSVLGGGGVNLKIRTKAQEGDVVRKVEIVIATVIPQIQISSWREVADFSS